MLYYWSVVPITLAVALLSGNFSPVIAQDNPQEIFISITDLPAPVIDGKWSSEKEWSHSSERKYEYEDGSKLVVRMSHDRENIYVLLDMVSDVSKDAKDRAIICFDTEVNGGEKPDSDDYCFISTFDGSFTSHRGGGASQDDNYLVKIANPAGAEMKVGISGGFDRYSPIPHLGYELKIPVDSLKRTDVYGFYVSVYDSKSKTQYIWPLSVQQSEDLVIPSPGQWGRLISPDKSLPEFSPMSLLILSGIIFLGLTLITRQRLV